jgi:lipopolysaccharide export system permease protein
MTLYRYFLLRFFGGFLRVFAVFAGILVLVGTIDQLSSLRTGQGIGRAFYLAVLDQTRGMFTILPLVMAIASVSVFIGLARTSELVVVRAAGRSGLQFLIAPVSGALIIGALAVAIFDPIAAATGKLYRLETRNEGSSAVFSVTGGGVWLRQGDGAAQSVIKAAQVSNDGLTYEDVSFFTFDENGNPISRIEAHRAHLAYHAWELTGARKWDLQAQNPAVSAMQLPDGTQLATDLNIDKLTRGFGAPSDISFWALPSYIADLERSGFSARSYRVWLQMEMALPLTLAVMVLIVAGFTMRHARSGKTGQMVIYALMAAFAIFFLRNFAQVLGQNGQIPAFLAAWGAPIAAALLAISLLLHLEDG